MASGRSLDGRLHVAMVPNVYVGQAIQAPDPRWQAETREYVTSSDGEGVVARWR